MRPASNGGHPRGLISRSRYFGGSGRSVYQAVPFVPRELFDELGIIVPTDNYDECDEHGALACAACRDKERPIVGEPFTYVAVFDNLAGLAADDATPILRSDGDFIALEVLGSIGPNNTFAGSPFTDMEFTIDADRGASQWSDGAIRGDMILGTAQDPGVLPAPVHYRPRQGIVVHGRNLNAAARFARVELHGVHLYDAGDLIYPRKPYWHRFNVNLAVANPVGVNVATDTDGPFYAIRPIGFSTGVFQWRAFMGDKTRRFITGTDQNRNGVDWSHSGATIRGIGEPWEFGWPMVSEPTSDITLEFQDLTGALPNNVTVYLQGIYVKEEVVGLSPGEIARAVQERRIAI